MYKTLNKILFDRRKALSLSLALAGTIGILSAIIISPQFATTYISSDHSITMEGLKELQFYRLISLLSGSFLLLIAVLLFKLPEKYLNVLAYGVLLIGIVVYLTWFGYNTLTRTHDFRDPDTMNFVDIARNIATGRGITQSALGFNQKSFSVYDQIPMPLTTQPPLFPLSIVFFSWFGLPFAEGALLISIISYGLILLVAYRISLNVYDGRTALLSVGFLLLYDPLRKLSSVAYSEPLGMLLLLTSLWMLIEIHRSRANHLWIPAVAGLASGLTFATRYALLPLFPLGVLFFLLESRRKLRDVSLYVIGFVVPAGLVLARNIFVSGAVMPTRSTSIVGFKSNVLQTIEVISKGYTSLLKPDVQAILLIISLLALGVLLVVQRKMSAVIQSVYIKKGGYLLTLWVLGYLAFLIFTKTRVYLDPIDSRFIAPAGIVLVMLFAALIVRSTEIKSKYLICLLFIILFFLIKHELTVTIKTPVYNQDQLIASSERLRWIAQHTTERDLIIGTGIVDIPFYLNRSAVLSFQYYPENDILGYEKTMAYCNIHRKEYERIYLILQAPDYQKLEILTNQKTGPDNFEANLRHAYGSFLTDILFMNVQKYPGVTFLDRQGDTYIYTVECQGLEALAYRLNQMNKNSKVIQVFSDVASEPHIMTKGNLLQNQSLMKTT